MQQTSIFEALEHLGRRCPPFRASRSTVRIGSIAVLLALGGPSGCSGGGTDGAPTFGREGSPSSTPATVPPSQSSAPPVINSASTAPTSAPSGSSSGVASPAPAAPASAPSRPAPAPAASESGAAPTNIAPVAAPPAKPAAPPAAEQDDGKGGDDEAGDDHGGGHEAEGEDDDGAPANAGAGAMGNTPPAVPPAVPPAIPPAAQTLSFERDVWPIFNAQCGPCHVSGRSGGQSIGSTNLDTAFADAVRVGRRITSELAAGDMPPACNGGNPGDRGCISSANDVNTITTWLDQGSPR